MFKSKKYKIVLSIFCMILTGCSLLDSAKGGGTIDKSDINAPKQIESKDITYFETDVYLTVYDEEIDRSGRYTFIIEQSTQKEYVLSVKGPYNVDSQISTVVSEEVLVRIQEIIDQYELVLKNGIDKVTAGLAPECAPMYLLAEYASNEKLYFREDGNPYSEWANAIRDYLENVLITVGYDHISSEEKSALSN